MSQASERLALAEMRGHEADLRRNQRESVQIRGDLHRAFETRHEERSRAERVRSDLQVARELEAQFAREERDAQLARELARQEHL